MLKIPNYDLKTERLVRTAQLFKELDNFPQLEKEPEIYSSNQETRKKLDQVLGNLYQLESKTIFQDSGNFALIKVDSPYEKLKAVLSEAGLSTNKEESYGVADKEGLVEIENFKGIENTRINVLVKSKPQFIYGQFSRFIPTDSVVEIIVLD